MAEHNLAQHFAAYSMWRKGLIDTIADYRGWLAENDLNDTQTDLRIQHLLDRLHEDKLNVAFVAEFSRGKSELINALLFADHGRRVLPSSAGRTTMCPTELLYDPDKPTALLLLPIETRATDITTAEYKRDWSSWEVHAFDAASGDAMIAAFQQVSRTKRVSVEDAQRYGLFDPQSEDDAMVLNEDGTVDVPCWRYAIINYPHPLLQQGLVILDTPGLNAIGTEPELTLNMLPNAHAVLFILAADTGVTRSEAEVWRNHISGARWRQKGRLAVLNKIDGLWDELKSEEDVARDIARQVATCAELLELRPEQIYPVSAQKALLAKIGKDAALLEKSRLPVLEQALSEQLIQAKKEIVRDGTESEITDLMANSGAILESRLRGVEAQLEELRSLRGKNADVVLHMMDKAEADRKNFEQVMQRFQAVRRVFAQHSEHLFAHLGMGRLRNEVVKTRRAMIDANFTKTIRAAMEAFFHDINDWMARSEERIVEIRSMMQAMYQRHAQDYGMAAVALPVFSTERYQQELARLERAYKEQFDTALNMLTNEKMTLTSKFFETLAMRVIEVYELANREATEWLQAIMAPMEAQVREQQLQLRRRLDSIRRIHQATDTLEERISELEHAADGIRQQIADLGVIRRHVGNALAFEQAGSTEALAA